MTLMIDALSDMDFVRDQQVNLGRLVREYTASENRFGRTMKEGYGQAVIDLYLWWRRERLPTLQALWKSNVEWEKAERDCAREYRRATEPPTPLSPSVEASPPSE